MGIGIGLGLSPVLGGNNRAYPNGVPLTGGAGSYIRCPDADGLDLTGDLEVVCRFSATDWTPAARRFIAAKWGASSLSWALTLETAGTLAVFLSTNGSTAASTLTSDDPTAFTDGAVGWLRFTRTQSTGVVKFFKAADEVAVPSSWTQLGADEVGTTSALWTGTSPVSFGATGAGGSGIAGSFYRLIVAGASTVADFNSALSGATGYTDAYGNVWSI